MTAIVSSIPPDDQQHLVLEDLSWDFYEQLLDEIANRHIRVTFDDGRLHVLHLTRQPKYAHRKRSLAFPFLPMEEFAAYIPRMHEEDQLHVFRDFRSWLASLAS